MGKNGKIKGHIVMVCANFIWGLMAPVAKMVLGAGAVSSLLLTDFRIFGAAILFWCASMFAPKEHVTFRDKLLLAGAGVLSILTNQGCYIFGVGFTSPAEASIITTTMPMWVMLLAAIFLKEPVTLKKVGGIMLGASGALILILNGSISAGIGGDRPLVGDLLVLTAQLSYALYLTLYKNFIKKYSVITLMKWMFLWAALLLLVPSLPTIVSTNWGNITLGQGLGAAYVVVFGTFVAYLCMMTGQKLLRPTVVGMYNYVQPVVASLVALSLGLDRFNLWKLLAVALIFTGVYLVIKSKSRADELAVQAASGENECMVEKNPA